jgi:cell division protein FtsQ
MKEVKCYQIILQLEFHLFRGNKINSEEFAQLCRVIYDDEFLKKNIIAIQIMPSGNLFNRNYDYQIDFGK